MMYPSIGAPAPARPQPLTRAELRRYFYAVQRANAPGKEDRIANAQAKRDRKNAKRARDHE